MDTNFTAEDHCRRGEAAIGCDRYAAALDHFHTARQLDPTNPRYRSYYGLCLGIAERRFDEALDLCRSAAREEFFNPVCYHNLARVHLTFGFKAEAIRYLKRGLMIDPANEEILSDLRGMGVRQRRALEFLPRRHLFNRWLGKLRGRVRAGECGVEFADVNRNSL